MDFRSFFLTFNTPTYTHSLSHSESGFQDRLGVFCGALVMKTSMLRAVNKCATREFAISNHIP